MWKNYLFIPLIFALTFTSCKNDDSSDYQSEYDQVYPGIILYNSASMQQAIALDGADVAIKFAMLLDECEGDPERFDNQEVKIFGGTYLLKNILFGSGNTITHDEQTGDYLITFQGLDRGGFDTFLRRGIYRIQTQGLPLGATTTDKAWIVKPEGLVSFTYGTGYSVQSISLSAAETRLVANGQGSYAIDYSGVKACFLTSPEYTSDWSGEVTFSCSTQTFDMGYTTHFDDTFTLRGKAEGASFYAFNSLTTTDFSYEIENKNPLQFKPSETGNASIIQGTELVRLTDPSDYSERSYPTNEVEVTRSKEQGETMIQIHYHDVTFIL